MSTPRLVRKILFARPLSRSIQCSYVLQQRNVISYQKRTATVLSPKAQRQYATRPEVDEKMEEIQELYGTARDEFEIAFEETEKQTVYAETDRAAAREELDKLTQAYKGVVDGPDREMAEQIKRRVGQRIRELDNAVKNMEEMAINQD